MHYIIIPNSFSISCNSFLFQLRSAVIYILSINPFSCRCIICQPVDNRIIFIYPFPFVYPTETSEDVLFCSVLHRIPLSRVFSSDSTSAFICSQKAHENIRLCKGEANPVREREKKSARKKSFKSPLYPWQILARVIVDSICVSRHF